ncbi:unnamed protein product [marine sediment metagenome]|uniref:Uncharacterized protein n=1 Tax=marine sediment metagenome TaxID=412755 RepID=X1FW86_9ZZZZ
MSDRYEGINEDYWFLRDSGYSFRSAMEGLAFAYAMIAKEKTQK